MSRRVHWQERREQSEKELVADCLQSAKSMNAFLEVAGQLDARHSGTSLGFPDAFLYCAHKCLPIEFKTKVGKLSPGQVLAQHKRMDQGVHTWIIRDVREFEELINWCRRTA